MNMTQTNNGTRIKKIAVAAFAVMTLAAFTVENAAAQCRIGGGNPGYGYGGSDFGNGYGNRYDSGRNYGADRYSNRNSNSRAYNNYHRGYSQTGYRGLSSQSPLLSFGLSLTGSRNSQYDNRALNSTNRSGYGNGYYNDSRRASSYQPSNRFDPRYGQSRSPYSRAGF